MLVVEKKKPNSEALLFRDFSLKVADVAGGNRDTVWAAGLLTELTRSLNGCQEQEPSDASYQTDLLICKL